MKTVIGLFDGADAAETSVQRLREVGLDAPNVAVLRSLRALWDHMGCRPATFVLRDFGIGVAYGALVGGLFGVIAAFGQLTLGFGETVALRTLIEFILIWSLFVGGVLGLFYGAGEAEQETRRFLRGILFGGTIVAVRVDETNQAQAQELLANAGAVAVKLCDKEAYRQKHLFAVHPVHDQTTLWTRRIARGLGIVLLVLVLALFIGEGLFGLDLAALQQLNLTEGFMLLAWGMALLGIVVAWVWEGVGGALIIGSILLFAGINSLASGSWRIGVLEPLFLLDGLLFLFNWWRTVGVELGQGTAQGA